MYSNVICTKLPLNSYKITFIVDGNVTTDIKKLSDLNLQKAILENFWYAIAWWKGALSKQGLLVSEVDIILPPLGEYLRMGEYFKNTFSIYDGVAVNVLEGVFVNIPNKDISNNIDRIDKQIKELGKKSFGMN